MRSCYDQLTVGLVGCTQHVAKDAELSGSGNAQEEVLQLVVKHNLQGRT